MCPLLCLYCSLCSVQVDDVIELIEKVDNDWFYARNADLEMCEGMIPARDLRLVRKLAGESTVSGFEEGPCAVAMFTFQGRESNNRAPPPLSLSLFYVSSLTYA